MPLADADDALTAEWRDLNEASADPCPFKSPDFVLPSSNLNDQPIQLITIRNRQTESLDGLLATTDARPDKFLGLEDASRKGEGGSSMHRTVVDQCHIHDAHSVSGHTRHGPHLVTGHTRHGPHLVESESAVLHRVGWLHEIHERFDKLVSHARRSAATIRPGPA